MKDSLDEILAILNTLMCDYGAYRVDVNFSNAHVTISFVDNPFNYRLYGVNEIMNRQFSLAYPRQTYLSHARLSQDAVSLVLGQFAVLSMTNDSIRLTRASLNIIDGLVGLTFSDKSNYVIPADDFLNGALPLCTTGFGDRYGT